MTLTRCGTSRANGSYTEYHHGVHRIVAFRYAGGVTVSGKGGRPRKWRTDADRVRAYRARQAGRPEPPELAQALDDGDELALALEQIRALKQELAAAAATERALRNEVRSVRHQLAAEGQRFGWLERSLETHRMARFTAEAERDALAGELAEVRARVRVADSTTRPPAPSSPATLSRVERRRQERQRQRRQ